MAYADVFEAASKNDFEAVKKFIEVDNVKPSSTQTPEGDTIAHIAVKNNNLNMVKYLLQRDPTLLDIRGTLDSTLLELAIGLDYLTLVKYFVDYHKMDILQVRSNLPPDTYVHYAAQMGYLDIFKYFIEERKIDVNVCNQWGQPPAFAAAREAHLHIIKFIVEEHGGDVTFLDHLKRNILCKAAMKCDLTIPRYLLDEKKLEIDVNNGFIIQDAISSTAYFKDNKLDQFLKYFIEEKHMQINRNKEAVPLHQAANTGRLDVVKYLVLHGADTERKDCMGRSPIQVATDESVIKYLTERNRTRRSLPELSIPHTQTRMDWVGMIAGSSSLSVGPQRSEGSNINGFLIIANAWINSKFWRNFNNRVVPTAQNILENRIDPVALDTIRQYFLPME